MVKIPSSTSNVPPHTTTSASTSTTEMKRVPPAITKKKSFFRIRNIFKRLISPKSTEEEEVEEGERESEVEKKKYSAHNAAGTLILPESSKNISSSSIVSPAFPPLPSTKTLSPSSDNQVQSRNIFKAGFMDEESEGLSADEDGGNDSRKRRSNNETTLGGGGSNNTVSSGTFSWLPNRKTLLSKKSMPNLKKSQWGGPNSVISLPIPPAVITASASPPALVVTSDGATKAPLNSNMLNNHINSPLTNNLYPATSIVTTDAVSTPRPPSSTVYKGDLNSRPSSESMIIKYYENSDYSSASSQYLLPYLKNKNTLQQQNNDYYDSSKGSIGNFTNPHSNTVLQFPSPPTPPVITTTVPVSSDLHYNLLPELLKTNRSTLIGYAGESHDLATKYGLVLPDKSFSQRNMGGIAPPILPDQHLLLLQHQKRQQIEQQHLQLQQLVYAALAGGGFPDEDSTAVSHYDNNNHVDIDIEEVGVAAPQLLSLGDLTDSVHEEEPFTHPTDEISVSDAGSICSAKGVTASSAGNVQQGQINIEEEDLQSQDIEF